MRALIALLAGLLLQLPAYAQVRDIDNAQLQQLIEQGVAVIDIRRADEWRQTGVVPGSRLLTFFQDRAYRVYDIPAWLGAVAREIPPEAPVVVICRTGNRTQAVADLLHRAGYRQVYNVRDGIVEWLREGRAVARVE